MKKMIALVGACMLLATMLVGCGHKHNYTTSADTVSHFQLCEACGKRKSSKKHKINEEGSCSTCGAKVVRMDDGAGIIYRYDDKGNTILIVNYDKEGNMLYSQRWEYQYDGENVISCKEFKDGIPQRETCYLPKTQPQEDEELMYCSELIYYNDDGSRESYQYNELGEETEHSLYDSAGNAYFTEVYTYERDQSGRTTKRTVTENGKVTREHYYEVDQFDTHYEKKIVYFDENGKIIQQEEYDPYGNRIDAEGEVSEGETNTEPTTESENAD